MKKKCEQAFEFLEDMGFQKTSEVHKRQHSLKYLKGESECLISWEPQSHNPSVTYSDENNLFGILDCEKEIRKLYPQAVKNKNEFLAWIFSSMPTNEFLDVFIQRIKSVVNG